MLWIEQRQKEFLIKMEGIDLSDFFHTKSQATDFSIHLATISEDIYQTNFDLEKVLTEHFGTTKKDKFISLLRDNKINIFDNTDLKGFLDKIQKRITDLPVLSLVVAFEPTDETFKVLSEWLILNIHKEVLLDITIDTKLIGGATVSFNGKYADCSIKPQFDQIFKDVLKNNPQVAGKITDPQGNHQSAEQITINS
jgi:F0F1-type ATP synthase delta subunit